MTRLIPSIPADWWQSLATLPWLDIATKLGQLTHKLGRVLADEGMYEILDYESTLELLDAEGRKARFHKQEKIRYLQNNILAYQDFAWGDGEILVDYQCTPGKVVDRYRPGQTTFILISLQQMKHTGDIDDFYIQWRIHNGFLRPTELWETQFKHRVKQFKINIIFPKNRPPHHVWLMEAKRRISVALNPGDKKRLPDGRWLVSWENTKPRSNERYLIKWDW